MSVAVVTAASGGIGEAVVKTLLAEKLATQVFAVDISDPAEPPSEGVVRLRCDLHTDDGLDTGSIANPVYFTRLA